MARGSGKRAYHKKDMNNLNRRALTIGGVLAIASLLIIIFSFLK